MNEPALSLSFLYYIYGTTTAALIFRFVFGLTVGLGIYITDMDGTSLMPSSWSWEMIFVHTWRFKFFSVTQRA
jgi:hypothetical protein